MKNKGFTLIELLVIIVIVVILTSVAIPKFIQANTRRANHYNVEQYQRGRSYTSMQCDTVYIHDTVYIKIVDMEKRF